MAKNAQNYARMCLFGLEYLSLTSAVHSVMLNLANFSEVAK